MSVQLFDMDFFFKSFSKLLDKIPLTLELTVSAFALGFLLGLAFALVRMHRLRGLSQAVSGLVAFLRGTPVLLQLYLIYYLVPSLLEGAAAQAGLTIEPGDIPPFVLVLIALGLNMSAYLSEAIRSALEAVSKGEIEAAYSIGMTGPVVFRRVILPEGLRVGTPNFSTILIGSLHATSLAFFVTLVDITGQANINAQENWRYLESFLGVGIIYWAVTILIEVGTHALERRLDRAGRCGGREAGRPALNLGN